MTSIKKFAFICLTTLFLGIPVAQAEIPTGERTVTLESPSGEKVNIGTISIQPVADKFTFNFTLNESVMGDHFLSMRPFKCLDGETMYCHLGYPYNKKSEFDADHFTDLEYEFLFIVRSPNDYGIDPYHGRYFVIKEQDGALIGEVRAVDLDILAAPPEDGIVYPITEAELDPIALETERFPNIRIQ